MEKGKVACRSRYNRGRRKQENVVKGPTPAALRRSAGNQAPPVNNRAAGKPQCCMETRVKTFARRVRLAEDNERGTGSCVWSL